jgi:hypothetical protein
MADVRVDAGICGFTTQIHAEKDGKTGVILDIHSDCPVIQKLGKRLSTLDGLEEIGRGLANSNVFKKAAECKAHAACPVPCGIMKSIEVALDLALPVDVNIHVAG